MSRQKASGPGWSERRSQVLSGISPFAFKTVRFKCCLTEFSEPKTHREAWYKKCPFQGLTLGALD